MVSVPHGSGSIPAGDAAEHDTFCQGAAPEPAGTMDAARDFAGGKES